MEVKSIPPPTPEMNSKDQLRSAFTSYQVAFDAYVKAANKTLDLLAALEGIELTSEQRHAIRAQRRIEEERRGATTCAPGLRFSKY